MLCRLAVLAFVAMLAFSPAVHVSMTNERGVLFVRARVDGIGPLLFIFDPGAADFITTYASDRLGGKPAREITLGEASARGSFPVLSGNPEQLDPLHDPGRGAIAGSIGPGFLQRYAIRIDYGNSEIALIPFGSLTPASEAERLPIRIDRFGMPTVVASVDRVRGRFEIDVRAPVSMLFTPFTHEHHFQQQYPHTVALGRFVVRRTDMRMSRASEGKFASGDVAGLFGNDVLSKFVVTLNYDRKLLYLER